MPPAAQDEFRTDLGLDLEAVRWWITTSYTGKMVGHWELWLIFGSNIGSNPCLISFVDKIPYLQVFRARYQDGSIITYSCDVKSAMVSDTIPLFRQIFASMVTAYPCFTTSGDIFFYSSFLFPPTFYSKPFFFGPWSQFGAEKQIFKRVREKKILANYNWCPSRNYWGIKYISQLWAKLAS